MSFLKYNKKLFAVAFLVMIFLFSFPNKTYAIFGFGDWVIDPITNIETGATTIETGITAAKSVKDTIAEALNVAARAAMKVAIRKLTQSTVNWINNGFKGNPAFVTDPGQFFLDIGDRTASDFISRNPALNNLCSPFKAEVRLALVKNYLSDDSQNYSCSLSKIKDNFEGFMSDFSQGGWDGWFEVTQNDQNNPQGAYLAARDQMYIQIGNQQNKYQKQIDLGKGFLSFEKCKPNSLVSEKMLEEAGTIDDSSPLAGYKVGDCLNNDVQTVTPGSVIETQLEGALGTGLKQLELARSADEVFSALITQLYERVLQSGKGLLDNNNPNDPQNTLPLPEPNTDKPTITLIGKNVLYIQVNSASTYRDTGAVATDLIDGDITDKIVKSGSVNTLIVGTYSITYNVTNSKGVSATTVTRTVNVVDDIVYDPQVPGSGGGGGGGGSGTPSWEPASLLNDVIAARARYGATLSESELSELLASVASQNSGWGLLRKVPGSSGCNGSDGFVACDILFHSPSCDMYDVLIAADPNIGPATPAWQFAGIGNRNDWVDVGAGGAGTGPCATLVGGGGTGTGGGTAPASLLGDMTTERNNYPSSFSSLCTNPSGLEPTSCPLGYILNTVAWNNRASGWGLSQKTSGHRCPSPAGEIACDILGYQPNNSIYDVFIDSENSATPTWGSGGSAPRPWVAPVQP